MISDLEAMRAVTSSYCRGQADAYAFAAMLLRQPNADDIDLVTLLEEAASRSLAQAYADEEGE